MANELNGSGSYIIDNCIPSDLKSFRQVIVEKELCIPDCKPDIDNILKYDATANLVNSQIIKTPKGTSLEGFTLTGYKLIADTAIDLKIQYSTNDCAQSVHAVYYQVPYMDFVVLPKEFSSGAKIIATPFVEDVYVKRISERCVYVYLALLIAVESC